MKEGPVKQKVAEWVLFFCSVCSPLSFPSTQVPETCADRWSGYVTVCLVLSERCVEGYSKPPALALGGPSLRDRERRSGNWAHMMFFHRHKGDLGEIQGEPREQRFCGSDGKQEEKRENNPRQKRREWAKGGGERRRVWETLSLLLHFICVWHHIKQGDFAKWVEWMNVEIYWSFPFLSCGVNAVKAELLYLNFWRDGLIVWLVEETF